MIRYIAVRLLSLIPILIGMSIVVFVIMRMLPGDVAAMILMGGGGDDSVSSPPSAEALQRLRNELGLDQPIIWQYLSWVGGLLTLDAGNSLWTGRPVLEEIANRLPLTIELASLALLISLSIAIPTGIFSALKQDSWLDYLFRSTSIAGLAIPDFWLGALTVLALTIWFGWTPPLGFVPFSQDPWTNIQQIIWPALVVGFSKAAVVSRMVRSTLLEVLREDYIRTAWAKGLRPRTVMLVHAFRNAMLPVLTVAATELGFLLSGTIVMETIFNLPGVGRYMIDAIFHRDFPVVQAIILLLGIIFITMNLIVDVLYGILDPRIRYE